MLVDLTPAIHRGIVDNTAKGSIRLQLWCVGAADPILLEMHGNGMQDIAGCRVEFQLPEQHEDEEAIKSMQRRLAEFMHVLCSKEEPFIAGDMTLSRRAPSHTHPDSVANLLSLEFFCGVKVRCVIETEQFSFTLGLPKWECSAAAARAQGQVNMAALHDHVLANVAAFRGAAFMRTGSAEPPACRWDFALNRAEAYTIIAPSIRAKYAGRPDADVAEAFVLDRMAYLHYAAGSREQGETVPTPPNWDLLDFLEPAHARLARSAMGHPLFKATAELSRIIVEHILSRSAPQQHSADIEPLLTGYSGIITRVLATIMLARESHVEPCVIIARVEALCTRMQKIIRQGEALHPTARSVFMPGANEVLAQLRDFLCKLRR